MLGARGVLLFLILLLAACAKQDRLVEVAGSSSFERGVSIGSLLSQSITTLYHHKLNLYSKIPGAIDIWHNLSIALAPAISEWAPTTAAELRGAASVAEGSVMALLAVEYELLMALGDEALADKCTGFSTQLAAEGVVAGQNNDEDPSGWLNGSLDVVLQMPRSEHVPAALIYTHPGWAAYMGVNEAGLVVLWQYIDDTSRNFDSGVPTVVLIRELLAQNSISDALRLLEKAPVAVPNNFILSDKFQVFDVEISPKQFSAVQVAGGSLVHTNHVIFDQDMSDHDVGINQSKTTIPRFNAMRKMLKRGYERQLDVRDLQGMLQTAPVFRNGTRGTDNHTLASMVFVPEEKAMHIRFKGDAYDTYQKYTL